MSDMPQSYDDARPWPPYRVRARNISRDAGPSVHSDAVAQSLGFAGALVAGRAIYSHLLHPLLERLGAPMLREGRCEVRFLKPAYEGEALTIHTAPAPGGENEITLMVRAENGAGEQVATLAVSLPSTASHAMSHAMSPIKPTPHARPAVGHAPFGGSKTEGRWHLLEPGRPLAAHPWHPTREENISWCGEIGETLPLFREGVAPPLHPGLVPTATTAMLHEQLIIRGWVHVSSVFIVHHMLRAGQALELRATPIEKWKQKGSRFLKLHVAVLEIDREIDRESSRVMVEEIRTALIKEA